MYNNHPKVFVSYSWEDDKHKEWVKTLTDRLLTDGIDATLDQYDLELGDRLPHFMEQSIADADFVLIVCTPTYKAKSDARKGGVGYEGHIISDELFNIGNERKFIPVMRKGTKETAIPNCLAGKLWVDLKDGSKYEENYQDLITTLLGKRNKPTVGHRPTYAMESYPKIEKVTIEEGPIRILGIITDEVTVPQMDGTRGSALYKIPFRLSSYPSNLWSKLFVAAWRLPPRFTSMHRSNIASVVGDKIILDGTTIEEVRDYHRETLLLCVEIANQKEAEILKEEQRQKAAEEKRRNQHFSNVSSVADEIKF